MKYFKKMMLVAICIIIIFSCAYFKTIREGLTNNNTIILLGDSILNNSNYVSEGKSVFDVLKTKTNNVYNFSKDGATINDLYRQLDKVPLDFNKSETYVFISAGGNDILNKKGQLTASEIKTLFDSYMNFIKSLRAKLGSVNVNILNLYLPSNPRYQSYESSIKTWNQLIQDYSNKIGEMYNVIDLYSLLTSTQDFVYDIEPSESASVKIANAIYYVN
jgi:lysophospholipase L1-like esterase